METKEGRFFNFHRFGRWPEFMRVFAEEVYGKYIGRRPIACFGNSDGDREMLIWTTVGRSDGRPSFGLIVHHTDAEREFAYDRERT